MKRSCQVTHAWCLSTHPQHTNRPHKAGKGCIVPRVYPVHTRTKSAFLGLGALAACRPPCLQPRNQLEPLDLTMSMVQSGSACTAARCASSSVILPWSTEKLAMTADVHVRVVLRGAHLLPRVLVWTLL